MNKKTNSLKPCGNPDCSTSTGICGSTTFGWGKLDDYGYWEIPCSTCARHYENLLIKGQESADVFTSWPYPSGEEYFNYCKSAEKLDEKISFWGLFLLEKYPKYVCAGVSVLSYKRLLTYSDITNVPSFSKFIKEIERVMDIEGWEFTVFPDEQKG